MLYAVIVGVALFSVAAVVWFCSLKGVLKPWETCPFYKKPEGETVPFRGAQMILIIICCFALALAIQFSLYKNTTPVNCIKLYVTFVIVFCAALIDWKRRIIPNLLVIAGLICRLGIYVYEILKVENWKEMLISDLIGFGVGFGFLFVVSLLTKGSIGMGDAKLFAVIGLMSGSFCTYSTLLVSLVLCAIVSLIGLATKKMTRKDSLPFGPFIAVGYILSVLLTSY